MISKTEKLRLWDDLATFVEKNEKMTIRNLLEDVQDFLKSREAVLKTEDYGFRGAIRIFLEESLKVYPIENGECPLDMVKKRFTDFRPSSGNTVIQVLEEILWNLLTAKAERTCGDCEEPEMEILWDVNTGQKVYSCSVCGRSELADGTRWEGPKCLVPASISNIR